MQIQKVLLKILLFGLFTGAVISQATAIPIISVQPSTQEVQAGQNFFVDIDISDVTDLFTWGLFVAFDPAVIEAIDIVEGTFLQTGGPTFFIKGAIDNTVGTFGESAATLLGMIPGVTGSGTLATIEFKALTTGTSSITPFNILLFNSTFPPGNTIDDFDIINGSVTVKTVPEPTTFALLSLGLVGLGVVRHKKKT